ncbi:hypothetical protein [Nocardia wallacei]|nr:hypothetical protein [Nocardia wallacei]
MFISTTFFAGSAAAVAAVDPGHNRPADGYIVTTADGSVGSGDQGPW